MDLLKLAFITFPALISFDYLEGVGKIILTVDASLEG